MSQELDALKAQVSASIAKETAAQTALDAAQVAVAGIPQLQADLKGAQDQLAAQNVELANLTGQLAASPLK